MKKLITLLAAMLFTASSAYAAGTLKDAEIAYAKGNYAQAIKLLKPLALKGDAEAQYNLGSSYNLRGKGAQDNAEAAKWYKLAAAQGQEAAQYHLGLMYANGQGAVLDYVSAHMWLNLAAITGDKKSMENRELVATLMTQQQITEAQKLARACLARKYKAC